MKKSIFASIIIIILMFALAYLIIESKKQKENLLTLANNFENIKLLDKDFNTYLLNPLLYSNFDILEGKIALFNYHNNKILNNEILQNQFATLLHQVDSDSKEKINKIQKIKSFKAILNNSFRIIQKLKKKIEHKKYDDIYIQILTLGKNPELHIDMIVQKVSSLEYTTQNEKYFLIHIKNILTYLNKVQQSNAAIQNLHLDTQLENLDTMYSDYAHISMQRAHLAIGVLFALLLVLIIIYLLYAFRLIMINKNLSRFKKTVENSDNIVVVTDYDQNITYVNEEFTRTTGYTKEEVLGKKPNILKSGKQSKEFYKKLNDTIYQGKKWSGEFINVDKDGELSYEKASITPVFDNKGKIKEFISIKLDITNETVKGQQLKEKEQILIQQSKMASMGEMLHNIAHQWRQPLSAISTISSGLSLQKELGMSNTQDEIKKLNEISHTVQYLSHTIDDFKDFFQPNKEKKSFDLSHTVEKTLKIIHAKLKSDTIEIIQEIDNFEISSFENEIIQVVLNILNNARDALSTSNNTNKLIFIHIYKTDTHGVIEIKDNAGGIPSNIIDKIFEPYFTTKHESQGTGIGLYMSYEMVSKHMKGSLTVNNVNYIYNNNEYNGALFTISIPLD